MKVSTGENVALDIYRCHDGKVCAALIDVTFTDRNGGGSRVAGGYGLTVQAALRELVRELDGLPAMEATHD